MLQSCNCVFGHVMYNDFSCDGVERLPFKLKHIPIRIVVTTVTTFQKYIVIHTVKIMIRCHKKCYE